MAKYNKSGQLYVPGELADTSVDSVKDHHSVSIEGVRPEQIVSEREINVEHETQSRHVQETIAEGLSADLAQGFPAHTGNEFSHLQKRSDMDFIHSETESLTLDQPETINHEQPSGSQRETEYGHTEEPTTVGDRVCSVHQKRFTTNQCDTGSLDQAQMVYSPNPQQGISSQRGTEHSHLQPRTGVVHQERFMPSQHDPSSLDQTEMAFSDKPQQEIGSQREAEHSHLQLRTGVVHQERFTPSQRDSSSQTEMAFSDIPQHGIHSQRETEYGHLQLRTGVRERGSVHQKIETRFATNQPDPRSLDQKEMAYSDIPHQGISSQIETEYGHLQAGTGVGDRGSVHQKTETIFTTNQHDPRSLEQAEMAYSTIPQQGFSSQRETENDHLQLRTGVRESGPVHQKLETRFTTNQHDLRSLDQKEMAYSDIQHQGIHSQRETEYDHLQVGTGVGVRGSVHPERFIPSHYDSRPGKDQGNPAHCDKPDRRRPGAMHFLHGTRLHGEERNIDSIHLEEKQPYRLQKSSLEQGSISRRETDYSPAQEQTSVRNRSTVHQEIETRLTTNQFDTKTMNQPEMASSSNPDSRRRGDMHYLHATPSHTEDDDMDYMEERQPDRYSTHREGNLKQGSSSHRETEYCHTEEQSAVGDWGSVHQKRFPTSQHDPRSLDQGEKAYSPNLQQGIHSQREREYGYLPVGTGVGHRGSVHQKLETRFIPSQRNPRSLDQAQMADSDIPHQGIYSQREMEYGHLQARTRVSSIHQKIETSFTRNQCDTRSLDEREMAYSLGPDRQRPGDMDHLHGTPLDREEEDMDSVHMEERQPDRYSTHRRTHLEQGSSLHRETGCCHTEEQRAVGDWGSLHQKRFPTYQRDPRSLDQAQMVYSPNRQQGISSQRETEHSHLQPRTGVVHQERFLSSQRDPRSLDQVQLAYSPNPQQGISSQREAEYGHAQERTTVGDRGFVHQQTAQITTHQHASRGLEQLELAYSPNQQQGISSQREAEYGHAQERTTVGDRGSVHQKKFTTNQHDTRSLEQLGLAYSQNPQQGISSQREAEYSHAQERTTVGGSGSVHQQSAQVTTHQHDSRSLEQAELAYSHDPDRMRHVDMHYGTPSHTEKEDMDSVHPDRYNSKGETTSQNIVEDRTASPRKIDILKLLELDGFYPEKITLQDVMQVGSLDSKSKTASGKVPWDILQNLIMLDQKGITREVHNCEVQNNDSPVEASSMEINDFTSMSSESDNEDSIHPSDIFMAIFACCDLNLRQILLQKMYQCRLALPFLFADVQSGELTFNLWALHTITLVWRDSSDRAIEASVADHPFNTVSCLRLGRSKLSKSQLLNRVICDHSQETFLNKDSPNGDCQRQLTDGLVEASFCLPGGRENDILKEPTIFLNLRGEGAQHGQQVDILSQISNVVVVSLDVDDLNHKDVIETMKVIHHNCAKIIMILGNKSQLTKKDQDACQNFYQNKVGQTFSLNFIKVRTFTQQREKNFSQVTNDVRKALSQIMTNEKGKVLQDAAQFMSSNMVRIDETNKHCQEGKKLAKRVLSAKHRNASKAELLPLQGEHWKEWCRLLKSKKRMKAADGGIQKVGSEEEQMKYHRLQQNGLCTSLSLFMRTFIEGLQTAIDSATIGFYLQWLKIYLDDASRQKLPPLQELYHEKLLELKDLKKRGHVPETHQLKKQINEIEKKIDDANLGLEHLMREIGQIYEAAIESHNEQYKQQFGSLPKLAADLLLGGHSLEIMDGDASGVPLTWLNAVFTEVERKIGDKKLFTLSVLGVQSSGKSTLLNTMFGLQFPVSAGRCTRGVYLQMVKVKYSKDLPFSYVAVLDTEGLRAQEIGDSKYDHDNELATFIIGLGTLTLINVKGENVSEIKDILQIVAHAFLRMKMVNKDIQKERACLFVHQNVPAVDAKEKMKGGEQKFQEALDRKTLEAAKLENISEVHCFSDVIQFDNQKYIWYFPDLWFGDPPMASVNTGYHEKVKELKSAFLTDIVKERKCLFRFSQLKDFIGDMWYGILSDDFVFSFRNSIVAKARKDLDLKFSELKWDLQLFMIKWLNKTQWEKATREKLRTHCQRVSQEAAVTIANEQERVIIEITKFIDAQEQMHPWKEETKAALQYAADSILRSTREDIDRIADTTYFQIMKDEEQDRHKEAILKKARQLAERLKGMASHDSQILRQEFEIMWNEWINSIDPHERSKEIPIVKQLESQLFEEFHHASVILKNELHKNPLLSRTFKGSLAASLTFEDIAESVLDAKKTKYAKRETQKRSWFPKIFSREEKTNADLTESVDRVIKDILKNVDFNLRKLPKTSDFHVCDAQTIFKQVREDLRRLNCDDDRLFSIPTDVEVRLVAMVASYSHRTFQEKRNYYDQNYSLTAQLEAYKQATWILFMNMVNQVKEEIIIVDLICGEIAPLVETAVMKMLRPVILEEIMTHFKGKPGLIKAVLIDLADEENFENYSAYISRTKSFTTDWLESYIDKYLFTQRGVSSWYLKQTETLIKEVIKGIMQSLEKALSNSTQNTSMDTWIRNFTQTVSKIIDFTGKDSLAMAKSSKCDFRGIKEQFTKRLQEIESNVSRCFSQHTMQTVKWINIPPQKEIMKSLWGCDAVCPFCKEPCKRSDQNHASPSNSHECLQHRPQGVAYWRWRDTNKIMAENCSFYVHSECGFKCSGVKHICGVKDNRDTTYHPYRDYKEFVPNWNIPPSPDMESSHYWMWYLNKFQHQIAAVKNYELPDIPVSWKDITKGSAIESLSLYD